MELFAKLFGSLLVENNWAGSFSALLVIVSRRPPAQSSSLSDFNETPVTTS